MTPSTAPSPAPGSALNNPLWQFSLGFYGHAGVAEFLLDCQDRKGADVCLLLWASYAAAGGRRLSLEIWRVADRSLAPRRRIIASVRRLRRWLGRLRPYSLGLYERCKRYEQTLEQRQLAALWKLHAERWPEDRPALELAGQQYGLLQKEQARWAGLLDSYKANRV
ncbi:TIGR02444 family protein [Microbulbifer thermotolerans]|uniref:TIGR02444 family protein n=1 Tax=Microbulbifer thermotolerans TaxID=252514 RepID=A0A143HQS4_MICTH|nr:TIGR02444 family protein [Microbulbifer thermotolerans]AMX03846.1 hypothetical protein A3224_15740 [Microbulbifer thermotolerans]MCX2778654.1 TIGR02444 family protein [Microbulbifer thermotolerans]MCX2783796.1 TIGR02444 family protein [Microbulbifer thermotolerans]MCX2794124.1 TIGR02444 family protein [Microbulbifer thermotolerans]MCX2801615.1 TIGR02444 family protein [Microbulbifer thermotolerans]